MYRCVNDQYDPDGMVPYESIDSFQEMCMECFGECPELTENESGRVYDDKGKLTLIPIKNIGTY